MQRPMQGVNTPLSTTTDMAIVAALPLPCDTNLDMDIDDPSELKTTHDVGSVTLAILLYKEYKDSTKPAVQRDMDKQTGSDSTGRRDSGTTSDNISTGLKDSGTS